MDIYYIYAYLREDGTPYYVGKGKENRAYSKQRSIHQPKDKSRIVFWHKDLSEEKAFELEKHYISLFGRKDQSTGILRNQTDGGEGCSGRKATEEFLQKMRSIKRSDTKNYRKPKSPEHKAKIAAANAARNKDPEFRKLVSEARKKYWADKKALSLQEPS